MCSTQVPASKWFVRAKNNCCCRTNPWYNLLGPCASKKIDRRPNGFDAVLAGLRATQQPDRETGAPSPVATTAPPPVIQPKPPQPTPKPAQSPKYTNSLGMTMMRIEPGEFLMGSTKAQIDTLVKQFPGWEPNGYNNEQPQHPVKITRPIYLGAHQVTVGQFRRFVESSGYKTKAEKDGYGAFGLVGIEVFGLVETVWKYNPTISWRNPGFQQGEDHPVVCVSHNDAVAFLNWLNDQEKGQKRTYRLPTEAEWEYACRGWHRGSLRGERRPRKPGPNRQRRRCVAHENLPELGRHPGR
jgi:formylglycine-generating enzyme required for sulfatase activity